MVKDKLIKTTQSLVESFTKVTMQMTRDADRVVATVLKPMRAKFFSKGWGPPEMVLQMCAMAIEQKLQLEKYSPVGQDAISWDPVDSKDSTDTTQVLEGRFRSPVAHLLSPEAQTAHFQLVLPRASLPNRGRFVPDSLDPVEVDSVFSHLVTQHLQPLLKSLAAASDSSTCETAFRAQNALQQAVALRESIPVCALFPATGEHGFTRRRRTIAEPLARKFGIGSLILVNPYYHTRKPRAQSSSSLLHAIDLMTSGCALIHEFAFLKRYLSQQQSLRFGPFGVSGISMGGINSLLALSVVPGPLAAVPVTAPYSAAPVFEDGALSEMVDWKALKNDGFPIHAVVPDPRLPRSSEASEAEAEASSRRKESRTTRQLLFDLFDMTDLRHYRAPEAPHATIQIAAPHDHYAPRSGTLLKEFWPQSELRWLPNTGHLSSYIFGASKNQEAVRDAFVRLLAGPSEKPGRVVVISDDQDDEFDYQGKRASDLGSISAAVDSLGHPMNLLFSESPPIL
ncbi:MAG: alpha/beta hydrolase family protein [archaeon]|nr:alpha/beta hydrolase family protein [archaeon]